MIVEVLYPKEDSSNDFYPVARVTVPAYQLGFNSGNTDALEYAYARTQNIFGSWSKGPQFEEGDRNEDYSENVEVLAPLMDIGGRKIGHRSSMIGDRMVINGKTYCVATFGFDEVG